MALNIENKGMAMTVGMTGMTGMTPDPLLCMGAAECEDATVGRSDTVSAAEMSKLENEVRSLAAKVAELYVKIDVESLKYEKRKDYEHETELDRIRYRGLCNACLRSNSELNDLLDAHYGLEREYDRDRDTELEFSDWLDKMAIDESNPMKKMRNEIKAEIIRLESELNKK
jgi:hypothetical protein